VFHIQNRQKMHSNSTNRPNLWWNVIGQNVTEGFRIL